MKKILFALTIVCTTGIAAQAQNAVSSGATQSANLNLSDAIEITFLSTGSATGTGVTMTFDDVNDYANGVVSSAQELRVRSNKNFKVDVKYDANTFMYTGNGSLAGITIPSDALRLMVVTNNTGGTTSNAFSSSVFKPIYSVSQDLLLNGAKGGDQRFSVKYQCAPGWQLPAGNYAIDVVYTATQL